MTDVEIFRALNMMSGLMHLWAAQAVILRCTAPARLCEIGVGSGDWAIGAATVSGAKEVTLIENFSLAQEDISPPYFWPSTSEELLEHCQQTSAVLGGKASYQVLDKLPPVAEMFDTIRLDCFPQIDEARQGIAWMIDHLAPQGILYVDDISCTNVPNRLLATIEQVQAKVLKPFWFAGNEGGFCHYEYDCKWIQDSLLANQGTYRARQRMFDDLPIVQTKQPSGRKEAFPWD